MTTPPQRRKIETTVTVVVVLCAVATTGLLIRREFLAPAQPSLPREKTTFIPQWRAALGHGERLGAAPANAPVQLIEFADYECPACGGYFPTVKQILERYPTQVSLTYLHSPLDYHRFALPAARAAECAREQGRFEAMHAQLFTQQQQFGLKPWTDMAREAEVPDLAAFEACTKSGAEIPRIVEGKNLAHTPFDIKGTPTLVINGWKLAQPPTLEEFDRMAKRILAGKSPVQRGT